MHQFEPQFNKRTPQVFRRGRVHFNIPMTNTGKCRLVTETTVLIIAYPPSCPSHSLRVFTSVMMMLITASLTGGTVSFHQSRLLLLLLLSPLAPSPSRRRRRGPEGTSSTTSWCEGLGSLWELFGADQRKKLESLKIIFPHYGLNSFFFYVLQM